VEGARGGKKKCGCVCRRHLGELGGAPKGGITKPGVSGEKSLETPRLEGKHKSGGCRHSRVVRQLSAKEAPKGDRWGVGERQTTPNRRETGKRGKKNFNYFMFRGVKKKREGQINVP